MQSLGITDVELLPVFAFDTQDVPAPTAALGLTNFWGYSPVSFFAPHRAYAAEGDPRREFRDMVKALHAAGIGVILDVVLNHTAEGGADGPTIGCKGLVNELFYLLDEQRSRASISTSRAAATPMSSNQPLVAQWLARVPAVLGRRDARRRLSLRSRGSAVARRGRRSRSRTRP